MDQQEFETLPFEKKLNVIYSILPKPTGPGESPLSVLVPKETFVREPWTPPLGPEGFNSVFGPYDTDWTFGSSGRAQREKNIARWGGLFDLTPLDNSGEKIFKAIGAGLGAPIAYIFDGDVFITFSKVAQQNPNWRRDLSFFMDDAKYAEIVSAAKVTLL